jgi:DNA-binding transcriptional ArsR family regulator
MNILTYKEKATLFQILSHPVRLQILNELRKRKACVCHLQAVTNRPQPYISQQLRVLRDAGLVAAHKDAQNVFYFLANADVKELLDVTFGSPEPAPFIENCSCPFCTAIET